MKRRALLSVSDKTGIVDFARELTVLGFEIISTGGTFQVLLEGGLQSTAIEQVTGLSECLDGRLKTLHPKIYGGILAKRDNPEHMEQISDIGAGLIELLAVNFYPFKQVVRDGAAPRDNLINAVENIDIGGPTMLRAAAKNYQDVTAVADPGDYELVIGELKSKGRVSKETNFQLASKVFMYTADYDSAVAEYLWNRAGAGIFPPVLNLAYEKAYDLRYGENPHQQAAFYRESFGSGGLADIKQLHGKELSFNNLNDTHGALELLREFSVPAVVACKHTVACGVGCAETVAEAYRKAYSADPVSIFGGVIAANREIDAETAEEINKIFIEIILAPGFTDEALAILKSKKNIRVLAGDIAQRGEGVPRHDIKKISGGVLVQQTNQSLLPDSITFPTIRKPSEKELADLLFAWTVVKHVKSNGIVIGKDGQSLGIGTGQVNRLWATRQAIEHAREYLGYDAPEGAALASDAFFPFRDCADAAAAAGITAIIQPGGSLNDRASIDACNEHGIAMVFTGMRHFK
ncbi:MAG: bifunctional phosphoribosylaminoimidazolecarboxamide formyltransferase/IMP cyclohydrolase, partial [Defluviitaleaceae bacterium]|nr:bifunctional phosphoribosylaminoimidazolecarboxamide formyltransferase/IMP cyclohydrolase [Defluviitaleaceae bacterium]